MKTRSTLRAGWRALGLAFGVAALISPAIAEANENAFISEGRVWIRPDGGGWRDLQLGVAPGSNLSAALTREGEVKVAFQGDGGRLWVTGDQQGQYQNLGLGMWNTTTPSIAASRLGGYKIAFSSFDKLWLAIGDSGYANLDLPMASGTSPSATSLNTGEYRIAYQGSNGRLWVTADGLGTAVDTGLGMWNSTSPSIAASKSGGWVIAFQSAGRLWLRLSDGGYRDLALPVAPGTSPSIAALEDGSYRVAFQGTDGYVWTSGIGLGTGTNTYLGAKAGTSPSIAAKRGGGYQVGFQANTGYLYTHEAGQSGGTDTGLGMWNATSPVAVPDRYFTSWGYGGNDGSVNTDAEADAVIDAIRAAPNDAAATAVWNGLSDQYPSDRWAVQQRMDSKGWSTSRAYGGANWKVDTDAEAQAFFDSYFVASKSSQTSMLGTLGTGERTFIEAKSESLFTLDVDESEPGQMTYGAYSDPTPEEQAELGLTGNEPPVAIAAAAGQVPASGCREAYDRRPLKAYKKSTSIIRRTAGYANLRIVFCWNRTNKTARAKVNRTASWKGSWFVFNDGWGELGWRSYYGADQEHGYATWRFYSQVAGANGGTDARFTQQLQLLRCSSSSSTLGGSVGAGPVGVNR